MKNKEFLVTINSLEDIKKYKELGIYNCVFPLKDFCVGIPNTFSIDEITESSYIWVNRIFDNHAIDDLKIIINNNYHKIKGIIFDDLGVLEIIKDIPIEKILYLTHFNTNSESVNEYLKMVDTVILSTDNTKEELEIIGNNAKKLVSFFVLGHVGVMYSRRKLLSNYCEYHNLDYVDTLEIENDGIKFILHENEYGTKFFNKNVFNGLELLELDAKYYFIDATFLSFEEIKKLINKEDITKETDHGFLYKETIYKLKEEKHD